MYIRIEWPTVWKQISILRCVRLFLRVTSLKHSKSLSYCGSEDRHKSFQDEKVKDEDSLKSLITFKQQL